MPLAKNSDVNWEFTEEYEIYVVPAGDGSGRSHRSCGMPGQESRRHHSRPPCTISRATRPTQKARPRFRNQQDVFRGETGTV